MKQARLLLEKVKGHPQTIEERKKMAIDLAALLLQETEKTMSRQEKKVQKQLSNLMQDPLGKTFTTAMTDQCFRAKAHRRIADQLVYLLKSVGVPKYLGWVRQLQLHTFAKMGSFLGQFLIPFITWSLRRETARVILPGEKAALRKHLQKREKEGVRVNLNHLGEAILSEEEARRRLSLYIEDMKNPDISYISVKISTIFSQIHLLSFEQTVQAIVERLKELYAAAQKYQTIGKDGVKRDKFVNLDMEEYRDLRLTVEIFRRALDCPEFQSYSAGIVLQAYLPDSHLYQKELTEWAQRRVAQGGAPIKIRIVKGANLAMEQFEASVRGWAQAPYTNKIDVDANYKTMVVYGCNLQHAQAVRLGVASHNLFDLAFAMLLRAENKVEPYVCFEMLEGMADSMRRVIQSLSGDMLLYCPIATKEEFQHAIAYLIRRLDENTGPENFLRYAFGLKLGSQAWQKQVEIFSKSCDRISSVPIGSRREQNRQIHPLGLSFASPFQNEADTDFALEANQIWGQEIARHWEHVKLLNIPLVIGGKDVFDNEEGIGIDPSKGGSPCYRYTKGKKHHLEQALQSAKEEEKKWGKTSIEHRAKLLSRVAEIFRERRGEFIGCMMRDAGKTLMEADVEVSEAIDFAEYYARQMVEMGKEKEIHISPKGTVLVTPPWNFPFAIPAGGVLAALVSGNCVILKPASDTVLVAWHLCQAIWSAGIPKEALQFLPCSGEDVGGDLVTDPRVNCVILTGGTSTAQKFLQMRPNLDLAAETGGKNAIIVTALSDRDLAIKELVQAAFGHAGQKCSAASLAILEKEVYDDPHFLEQLKSAVASLVCASPFNLKAKMPPLIHAPKGALLQGLTKLEPGEKWLLKPKQDEKNPCLWTPGIKLGVQRGGFTHMTELFGPVLGLMRAKNLSHAIELANQVPFGLTTGLFSLDTREQTQWIRKIEAGNLYLNRGITGAIVRRQPFGGTKLSSFGNGSKAGGPNYLREFVHLSQYELPLEKGEIHPKVNFLMPLLEKLSLSTEMLGVWTASVANYAAVWKKWQIHVDLSKVVGQDNFFYYVPRKKITLRLEEGSSLFDALRVCSAMFTCNTPFEISTVEKHAKLFQNVHGIHVVIENISGFCDRIKEGKISRIRTVETASYEIFQASAQASIHVADEPVLASGRHELLHYVREIALSIDYHRYGNLGAREQEKRSPIL